MASMLLQGFLVKTCNIWGLSAAFLPVIGYLMHTFQQQICWHLPSNL